MKLNQFKILFLTIFKDYLNLKFVLTLNYSNKKRKIIKIYLIDIILFVFNMYGYSQIKNIFNLRRNHFRIKLKEVKKIFN